MKDVTDKNFGVVIAFLLFGFLFLWGISFSNDEIASWLVKASSKDAPLIGSFLYATIASLALGLLIDAVRAVVVEETFYRLFRLGKPEINSSKPPLIRSPSGSVTSCHTRCGLLAVNHAAPPRWPLSRH
jgi:hypothetical protein